MFMSEKEFIAGNVNEELKCPKCGSSNIEYGDGYDFEVQEDYIISKDYHFCGNCGVCIDTSQYYRAEKFVIDGFDEERCDDE